MIGRILEGLFAAGLRDVRTTQSTLNAHGTDIERNDSNSDAQIYNEIIQSRQHRVMGILKFNIERLQEHY
jgi:hypothetical protein